MSRKRARGYKTNGKVVITDFNDDGSFYSQNELNSSGLSQADFSEIIDSSTPDWRKRKSEGQIVMNPMSLTKLKRTSTDGTWSASAIPGWGTRVWKGSMCGVIYGPFVYPSWIASRTSDAKASTLVDAYSKIASSEWQSMVSVVEARKTASMLAGPFAAARELVSSVANRRLKELKRGVAALQAFNNAWNEYRFGWKPLLYEISNIMEAYSKRNDYQFLPKRFVARSSYSFDHSDVVVSSGASQYGLSNWKTVFSYDKTIKVASGVLYELYEQSQSSVRIRNTGLRLGDIPATLWELVPYSFVVDRFASVGPWLNAIVPKPGVRVLGNWQTVIDEEHSTNKVTGDINVNYTGGLMHKDFDFGTLRSDTTSIQRVVGVDLPWTPPKNLRELSIVQQVDHYALTMQRLLNLRK